MTIQRVRLVDGARELILGGRSAHRRDLILHKISAPSPTVRRVSADRSGDDGADDDTTLHGPRSVSIELTLCDRPAALAREIRAFLDPAARPYLCVLEDEYADLGEIRIRLASESWPDDHDHLTHIRRPYQVQWVAPDGSWETTDPVQFEVRAATAARTGITFPAAFPWTFPGTSPAGVGSHLNPGRAAHHVVRLYGPCAGPRWTCVTTGEAIIFRDTLVLAAGEFVEVDTRRGTATAMGQPDASRLSHMDFAMSTWWRIPAGPSEIRYHPVSGVQSGAAALAAYRPTLL